MRASNLFDPRAQKTAGKAQPARTAPAHCESPPRPERLGSWRARHGVGERQHLRHGRQTLPAPLAAVATRVDPHRRLPHRAHRRYPRLGLGEHAAERPAPRWPAERPRGQPQYMRPQPFGPAVPRRMRRRALTEQIPGHRS